MSKRSRGANSQALLLVLALFLAMPGVVLAGGSNGEDSSNHAMAVLRMGVGTRALGMGGASVAAATDATAGYWNPAALCNACGTQVSGMHALGLDEDRRMSFIAGSMQMDWGALGMSFLTAGMSDIPGYDPDGNSTGDFSYGDMALMFHGAYQAEMFAIGGTFKYLHQGLDADVEGDDGVSGVGFDFGVLAEMTDWANFGVTLRDVVSSVGDEEANEVPLALVGGVALMPLEGFTFAFDLEKIQDEDDLKYHAGAEAAFGLTEDIGAAIRLGLNNGHMSAGLGLDVAMIGFNYAFVEENEDFLGDSHRIGVTLKLGEECENFSEPKSVWKGSVSGGRDRDLDGILDKNDACPTSAEDLDGFEDSDGCPDVDNDGDGIDDVYDKCPDRAEDFDGYQDKDGCPDVDNDEDGVLDKDDRCPGKPETFNSYQDTDGCPDEVPVVFPMANINFRTGSAEIAFSDPVPVLEEVARIMRENPEINVMVEGHTDNIGGDKMNLNLSQRRAEAVKAYLVNLGISVDRFNTAGKGETVPLDTNDTPEGRARNRRIEFKVFG
jgi:outer membrane protein OmpA-like peptidoglycan-associated protein